MESYNNINSNNDSNKNINNDSNKNINIGNNNETNKSTTIKLKKKESDLNSIDNDNYDYYEELLDKNKKWAAEMVSKDPDFFNRLVNVQKPKYLFIGCSDSRVAVDQITQTVPGELFIHRNVANLVVHTDMNFLSVLQYAVFYLKVEHVIVCGHYGCGGVKAAMGNDSLGLIDAWIKNIKDVYRFNEKEFVDIKDEESKLNKLIEINVKEQVNNLSKTTIVQKAWKETNLPYLHGWVYDLKDGIIKPVKNINPNTKNKVDLYNYKFY